MLKIRNKILDHPQSKYLFTPRITCPPAPQAPIKQQSNNALREQIGKDDGKNREEMNTLRLLMF
jgi:hypothetical protein